MRKLILALAALISLSSAACAAFAIFQTYIDPRTQVSLTTYGGVCNTQSVNVTATIAAGSPNLSLDAGDPDTFVSGDVGKTIVVQGAGANVGGNIQTLVTTIQTFTNSRAVVLAANATTALSGAATYISFGANDTAAFNSFKTAFQGSAPVQLNLPGNCSYRPAGGGSAIAPFYGIDDLIVSGNGAATSGITNLAGNTGNFLFGGLGQLQNSNNSVRTTDVTAGDSCVTLKTTPAVTVSAIDNSQPNPAVFTASSSGTTLTVTAVTSGTIAAGAYIGNTQSVAAFTSIQPYGTGGTTGVGGVGTYALSASNTFVSQRVVTKPASFNASVGTTGVMTVNSIADGVLAVDQFVYSQTGGLPTATAIKSQLTGTPGGVGTYQLSVPIANAIASTGFQANGQMRVTLNSTSGLTSGDTLFLTGVSGNGGSPLPNRVNGLRWIKVVNGTQVDIFQSDYDGGYTPGTGTGGGDRTALFPVGSNVMLAGYTTQSYWANAYSYPGNYQWFEYATVASTDSTTHQVCFTAPLEYSYSASWPQYNTGSPFEIDPGGPATVYHYDDNWDLTHVYKDLTLDNIYFQTSANGRDVTWENVTMKGAACAIPTQNVTYRWTNVTGTDCTIETDKLVKAWYIRNSTLKHVGVQSPSIEIIDADGLTVSRNWLGSSKKQYFNNVTISGIGLNPAFTDPVYTTGAAAYGVTEEVTCTNCAITGGTVGKQPGLVPTKYWTMSSGVITIPNELNYSSGDFDTQTRLIVPGHYAFWSNGNNLGKAFKIVSVTADINNTYVTTSEAGGFPTGAWASSTNLAIQAHPAPLFTASGTSTNSNFSTYIGCTALPFNSCQNFTNTGGAAGTTPQPPSLNLWGEMDTFTVTNNVPYTGAGALTWTLSRFNNWQVLDPVTLTLGSFPQLTINMKLPSSCGSCTRSFANTGVITNSQVGDVFSAPVSGALFGVSHNQSNFSANTPSDSPQVTVTLRTNQNLPP